MDTQTYGNYLCKRKLMDKLGAPGTPKNVTIHTMTTPSVLDSVSISISVEPLDGGNSIDLNEVVVVEEIPV